MEWSSLRKGMYWFLLKKGNKHQVWLVPGARAISSVFVSSFLGSGFLRVGSILGEGRSLCDDKVAIGSYNSFRIICPLSPTPPTREPAP